jgi:hypothetical protein
VLTILSNPHIVLVISGGFLSGIESFVSLGILDGLSQIGFGGFQSSDGVVSQFSVSSLLGNVVVDVGVQISDNLMAII